jgi:hypothetical protein
VVPVPSESRKRRKQEPEPAVDPEREQDAWDEFAADYYESELTVRLWTVLAVPNRRAQCIPFECLAHRRVRAAADHGLLGNSSLSYCLLRTAAHRASSNPVVG